MASWGTKIFMGVGEQKGALSLSAGPFSLHFELGPNYLFSLSCIIPNYEHTPIVNCMANCELSGSILIAGLLTTNYIIHFNCNVPKAEKK